MAEMTVHLPTVHNGGGGVALPQGVIDPLVLQAILQIESGGSGIRDGRVVIRFEPSVFEDYVPAEVFAKHFRYGNPVWSSREFNLGGGWRSMEVGGQLVQWEAFDLAKSLNAEAAAQSISMGAPQIMGFNHESIGYTSATAMLQAFRSEPVQVIAFINFILGRPRLASAVRNKDWRDVARIYNGVGQVNLYAARLEQAYRDLVG